MKITIVDVEIKNSCNDFSHNIDFLLFQAYSYDTEAFAIADTMQFIRPSIRTICVGQAFGTAAMLLSLGQKGKPVSCYLNNFVVTDFFSI